VWQAWTNTLSDIHINLAHKIKSPKLWRICHHPRLGTIQIWSVSVFLKEHFCQYFFCSLKTFKHTGNSIYTNTDFHVKTWTTHNKYYAENKSLGQTRGSIKLAQCFRYDANCNCLTMQSLHITTASVFSQSPGWPYHLISHMNFDFSALFSRQCYQVRGNTL